jgi:hypothetical protein
MTRNGLDGDIICSSRPQPNNLAGMRLKRRRALPAKIARF